MNNKQKKSLYKILITIALLVLIKIIDCQNVYISFCLYLIPYFVVGYDVLKKAIKGIKHKQVFDENFLMSFATIGSFISKEFEESVFVMLFYQIGELFQSYAIGKSRKNIAELMDIRPDYANIELDGELQKVDPSEVKIGTIITVKVGEKIPIDGIVFKGTSSLNTSALTGESLPRDVKENDEVISGCINMESPLLIKTTKDFGESTVSQVLELVENASSNKSNSEQFITKFAKYYTPIVCYSAIALAIIPPLFINLFLNGGWQFSIWASRALTFLVISCPCALVISIPLSFFGGIGGASNTGILIKGSNYLEALAKTKYVAFDKTGTMTKGIFEVTTIHNAKLTANELLRYAAHAEAFSNHPIGKSIIKEYGKELNRESIESIKELPGKGIIAIIEGHTCLVGNNKLMEDNNIVIVECNDPGSIIHVAIDNEYKGHIHIGDQIKPTSKQAIKELRDLGIKKIIMLTGDEEKIANDVSTKLGIDETYCELMPQNKDKIVADLLAKKDEKDKLIFVGDGINDAAVISRADVGVAMGALGSDAAIEAADIVLMDDDPLKIAKAIRIAKKTMRIVYENISFAIGVKIICLILSTIGIANMWLAIFADVGVMIIAVLNAIRALNVKRI
ncbi:MAG: heavy metal translocating P-type ATPase [Erysipelotrichaceae bacterium]|nr:heavy metal translocating P-type ATPase [Erysipelotrichaceae bacterium]